MKKLLLAGVMLASFSGSVAQAQEMVYWPAQPGTQGGQSAYFPMGTALNLTTRTELNTKYSHAGDRFYLEVAEPLIYRGQVVVPVGSLAVGEVARAERNGHFGKKGQLEVRLLYVQTPNGPVWLSGRHGRSGTGQGVVSIGGAVLLWWPMLFIHGTSGRLPADTAITAYLGDELRFTLQPDAVQSAAAVVPDSAGTGARPLAATFDPRAFSGSR